jgi:F-type H+-transporting ATPase subunit gamma
MSNTQESLRRKIDGAGKLESVVRTMKAVAASSIGQYEAAVSALAEYERSVQLGLSVCFRGAGSFAARSRRGGGPTGAIVFGSDQGLVGQFNETMAEFVLNAMATRAGEKKYWVVGERIQGRLEDAGVAVEGKFAVPGSVKAIGSLVAQLQIASESQENGGCTVVQVFHMKRTSGALCEPVSRRLLPLGAQWQKDLAKIPWPTRNLPELFGDEEANLRAFVGEYLFISLFKACAESLASENTSRLAAMQRAEKNIDLLLTSLSRAFHGLRQSSIDEELFDVISGFNALTRHRPGC